MDSRVGEDRVHDFLMGNLRADFHHVYLPSVDSGDSSGDFQPTNALSPEKQHPGPSQMGFD